MFSKIHYIEYPLYCESVDQRAAKLWSVKLWRWSDRPGLEPGRLRLVRFGPRSRIFLRSPTLTACSFAVLWSTETHNTSLKRSKPPLLTQSMCKSLEAFLLYLTSVQITLISSGLISKGAVFVGPICRTNLVPNNCFWTTLFKTF